MRKVWNGSKTRRHSPRDFHRRRYGNPLFDRPSQRGSRSRPSIAPGKILIGLAALIAAAGLGYVLWSPALRIDEVVVGGATPETEESIRRIVDEQAKGNAALIFPRGNLLFFGKERARRAINDAFFFESLEMKKRLPHTLEIQVAEKPMRAALAEAGRFYALDDDGKLLRDLTGKELAAIGDLPPDVGAVSSEGLGAESFDVAAKKQEGDAPPAPLKQTSSNRNPFPIILGKKTPPGDTAVQPSALALILDANARLSDIAGSAVRWFVVQDGADTVDVTMEGDWHILLTTAIPFDVQSERLAAVLREKIGDRKNDLEYVDLRYNERIFFRFATESAPTEQAGP